jgi:hypothetical protein
MEHMPLTHNSVRYSVVSQRDTIKQAYRTHSTRGAYDPPVSFVLPPRKSSHSPKYVFTLSSILKKAENCIEITSPPKVLTKYLM